ncbi:MAG: NirF protein, partial [Candidatus Kuenenia stuttgartiensis]|nr:NirF protein [Candidatus Kuenenia stuttgartiensis]
MVVTTGIFILYTLTSAFAEKIYVVERERERLAVIENGVLSGEIGNLGNLNHATVKFNKNFMYVI